MLIDIDFDGVIGDNRIEDFFSENSIDDYIRLAAENPRKLNIPLLKYLDNLKKNGHILRLWTNRNDDLKKATINNLGNWKSLFDSFMFLNGYKITTQVEGIVIDNHTKHLKCGEFGILYPTFY